MANTAHNPETGEYAVREPGLGWQVVDRETYDMARGDAQASGRGLGENFGREAGSQVVDAGGGAVEDLGGGGMLGPWLGILTGQYGMQQREGSLSERVRDVGQAVQASNDAAQEARYRQHPGIGAAAAAATALIPVGGGAKVGTATRLGTRPGQRVVGETTAKTVSAAEAVVERNRVRGPWEAPEGTGGRSVGARANPNAPEAPEPERVLNGMLTPEEMDSLAKDLDLGPVLTRGDRKALTARVDTDEMNRADALRSREERSRSNIVADRARGGGVTKVNDIRDNAANAATRLVMNELGEGQAYRLTSANMRNLVEQSQEVFESAAREAGDIPVKNMQYAQLQDIADDVGADDLPVVQRMIDNISKDAKDNGDVLPNKLVRDYRSKVGRAAQRAAAGDNFERSIALRDIQEWLDKRVDERVSGETREALAEARYRWRIIRALESSTASTDAGGKVNLPSFSRAFQRGGNRFFRSTGKEGKRGEEFSRALETFRYLTAKVEPDSGTAGRVIQAIGDRAGFLVGGG